MKVRTIFQLAMWGLASVVLGECPVAMDPWSRLETLAEDGKAPRLEKRWDDINSRFWYATSIWTMIGNVASCKALRGRGSRG